MIALSTLNLQVIDNLLFYLGLALVPNIRTKNWNQHSTVHANSEQYHKWKEEDHGDGVGTHGYHKAFICGVVVADVKKGHEGTFEWGELPGLPAEKSVTEDSECNKNGAEGYKEFTDEGVGFF